MDWKSEIYDVGFIIVGLGMMMIFARPEFIGSGLENLVWVGFAITVGGSFITTIMFEMITRHYLCVRLELPKSKCVLYFYIEEKGITTKAISTSPAKNPTTIPIMYATKFRAHWIETHPYYGKIQQFIVHHHLPWADRGLAEPGKALFKGNVIEHALVVKLTCFEYDYSSDRQGGMAIPAFMLAFAPNADMEFPIALPKILEILEANRANPRLLPQILSSGKAYEKMKFGFNEKAREAAFYKSEKERMEQTEQSYQSALDAAGSSVTKAVRLAWNIILDWHDIFQSIDNIVKYKKDWKGIVFNKFTLGIVIVAVSALIMVLQPELVGGVGPYLAANWVPVIVTLAIVVIGIYLVFGRKMVGRR